MGAERISFQTVETETNNAITANMAEKARNAPSAGNNRACSNGRNKEDKCSNDVSSTDNRICSKKPIYYGRRQEREKKLL